MNKETNKFDLNEVIIEGIIKEKPTQDSKDGLYKSVITVREEIKSKIRKSKYYDINIVMTKKYYINNFETLMFSKNKTARIEGKLYAIKNKKRDGTIGHMQCVMVENLEIVYIPEHINIVNATGIITNIRKKELPNQNTAKVEFGIFIENENGQSYFKAIAWDNIANAIENIKPKTRIKINGEMRSVVSKNKELTKKVIFQHINVIHFDII